MCCGGDDMKVILQKNLENQKIIEDATLNVLAHLKFHKGRMIRFQQLMKAYWLVSKGMAKRRMNAKKM